MATNWTRMGGLAAMVGGALWALTPLREPVFGGGRYAEHPVFRPYNAALLLIAVLLIVGLLGLHARYRKLYGRLGTAGFGVIVVGYGLLFVGSAPAVLFTEDGPLALIRTGQDLGFLGALVCGVGAILLGIGLWRSGVAPRSGALLLIIALPVGIVGIVAVSAAGFEDVAGLPLTVLYGVAWLILGHHLRSTAGESTTVGVPGTGR